MIVATLQRLAIGSLFALIASGAFGTQASLTVPGPPLSMSGLAAFLNAALLSVGSCQLGTLAPANGPGGAAFSGECWIDSSGSPWLVKRYDGTTWIITGQIDPTGHTFQPYGSALILTGSTNGSTRLQAAPTATGTLSLPAPATADTLVSRNSTDTLTSKTFDTAGTGNSLLINGLAVTANTGTGAVVRATSPTLAAPILTTPNIGAATGASLNLNNSPGQYNGLLSVRTCGAGIEFGHTNTAGYGSTIAADCNDGRPFLAFNAGPGSSTPNSFRTLGIKGAMLQADLLGGIIVGLVPNANADNQSLVPTWVFAATGGHYAAGATGGDQGVGTINASGLFISGISAITASSSAGLTNKTFDTAAAGNVLKINGTQVSTVTGAGAAVLASSPSLTTPNIGAATATSINGMGLTASAGGSITLGAGGPNVTFNNSLTFAGTGGTTITFQGTDTYVGRATTDTLTNKTFDTAGAGNVLKINGTQVSAVTGSGPVVLANSPSLSAPSLSAPVSTGLANVQGALQLSTESTPPQLTTSQNNYNPGGVNCATSTTLIVSASAAVNITGLGGGVAGCIMVLINNGTNTITLRNQSASSSAANQFNIGADFALAANFAVTLKYDATDSFWRQIGGPSAAGSGSGSGNGTLTSVACGNTTITTSGTCYSNGQLNGTTTNDNASPGNIGEYVASNCPILTATVTITIASPAVVTFVGHGMSGICPVVFSTSGSLPTGITAGTTYWTIPSSITPNTFQIATSIPNAVAGTAVNTSGSQSGTQTGASGRPMLNNVASDVSAVSVTAGDWDCTGNAGTGFSNSIRSHTGWISTVSQTDPFFPNNGAYMQLGFDTPQSSFNQFLPLGTLRVSVATATIVYLSMRDFFPTGTDIGWGSIACRRRR
jgi:hypothetical protein